MKKISLTFRIPIFIDVDLDIEDDDFEEILEEWDRSNFGIVKSIAERYVDADNLEIGSLDGAKERFGDTEIVDLRLLSDPDAEKPEEVVAEDDFGDIEINTIMPKGKPN